MKKILIALLFFVAICILLYSLGKSGVQYPVENMHVLYSNSDIQEYDITSYLSDSAKSDIVYRLNHSRYTPFVNGKALTLLGGGFKILFTGGDSFEIASEHYIYCINKDCFYKSDAVIPIYQDLAEKKIRVLFYEPDVLLQKYWEQEK